MTAPIEIDATGQAVGRVATQVAMLLQGKNKATYTPRIDDGEAVLVKNASKVYFSGDKLVQKSYYHHTQYPGGLRRKAMKHVFDEDPADVIRRAVIKMLPKNSFRNERMKRLTIEA